MKLTHVLRSVFCEPWLIQPAMHSMIRDIVVAHCNGSAHEAGGIAELFGDEDAEPDPILSIADGIATIRIEGVIGKRVGALEKTSGVTDLDDIAEALRSAQQDPSVQGIVLSVDSPGGTVAGVEEVGDMIYDSEKRVVAFSDIQAASAAYWLASQAQAFVVSASAPSIGSVGVYLPVLDQSAAFAARGLKMEVIKSGKYKGMGIQGTTLTDEQRAHLQSRTAMIHARFKAAVLRMHKIGDEDMEGQDFFGHEAVARGFADEIGDMDSARKLAWL
jgi:signal peptide peptidase SppA